MSKKAIHQNYKPIYRMWSTIFFAYLIMLISIELWSIIINPNILSNTNVLAFQKAHMMIYLIALFLNLTLIRGKAIAYLTPKGLQYKDLLIPYTSIEKLHYKTGIPESKRFTKDWYSRLEITYSKKTVVILHAPRYLQFYLFFKAKKKVLWQIDGNLWFAIIISIFFSAIMTLSS